MDGATAAAAAAVNGEGGNGGSRRSEGAAASEGALRGRAVGGRVAWQLGSGDSGGGAPPAPRWSVRRGEASGLAAAAARVALPCVLGSG